MLSSSQVGAVVANVSAEHAGLYAALEDELRPAPAALSVVGTAAAMRLWRLRAEATDERPEAPWHPSELRLCETMDGRRELSGHFCPEGASVVEAAIVAATPKFDPIEEPLLTGAERRAPCRRPGGDVPVVLGQLERPVSRHPHEPACFCRGRAEGTGFWWPRAVGRWDAGARRGIEWLSCGSELHRLVTSGRSTVLDYGPLCQDRRPSDLGSPGRARPALPPPGCDRPPSWCGAHHVVNVSKGGPTRLDNLVLACSRHHHLWHDQSWQLNLARDGTLRLVPTRGLALASSPAGNTLVSSSLF